MKYTFIFLLILSSDLLSQKKYDFIFTKDKITILNHDDSLEKKLYLYNGEIEEDLITSTTPILGKTFFQEDSLHFTPVVPLGWDRIYTLVYNHSITYFKIPIPKNYKKLSVEEIYPTSSKLPSNILKWYIKFSNPINRNNVYDYFHFINAKGDTLSRAILPLENILINRDKTLVTLWIEPGRQKRKLIPNQLLGSVFTPRENYRIIISKNIKDSNGVSMQKDYIKSFSIIDADRSKPNISQWHIEHPKKESLSPLIIKCYEPLDYGSVLENINISYKNQIIRGTWELSNNERIIQFLPKKKWKLGNYQINFNKTIEDLAGNNLSRLFDNEIDNTEDVNATNQEHILEFSIY
ncbi:Ig-like domain-containing protein [uncultured Aquimarina sp.]|uniref:Ig-like domain-containing protein n=1 Tax=uncultured Aquimarina sp. TaxID=575652 RepID=UPI002619AE6D|nr:Ig-like domain-containing protein [uncultured Aquimarina sp.]